VRRSLVPSRTTLLGLVKHATFVEKGLVRRKPSRAGHGPRSASRRTRTRRFILDDTDTICHRPASPTARRASHRARDGRHPWGWTTCFFSVNRRGPLPAALGLPSHAARTRTALRGTRTSCGSSFISEPPPLTGRQSTVGRRPSTVNSTRTRVVTARRPWEDDDRQREVPFRRDNSAPGQRRTGVTDGPVHADPAWPP